MATCFEPILSFSGQHYTIHKKYCIQLYR